MADCVFCDIVSGRTPAAVVFEDSLTLAFLDRRPLFPGHTLLIPREHHTTLMDLPPELVAPLFANAQRLSRAVELAMQAEGLFLAVNNRISQSVPHLHLHLVPRRKGDGLKGFFWPRTRYDSEEQMQETALRIRAALEVLEGAG
jgi:histidine triad (HIT) family protein